MDDCSEDNNIIVAYNIICQGGDVVEYSNGMKKRIIFFSGRYSIGTRSYSREENILVKLPV